MESELPMFSASLIDVAFNATFRTTEYDHGMIGRSSSNSVMRGSYHNALAHLLLPALIVSRRYEE